MTALAALTAPVPLDDDVARRPVPWRRMAWVTWRQHRVGLGGAAALLCAVSVYMWIAGLQLHHAYTLAAACHPASSIACGELISHFDAIDAFLANGLILQALPLLLGTFVGAPVLARELETGTFRFAWTQGFGRRRWALAKLVGLAVLLAAAAGAVGALLSWYYQPYFAAGNTSLSLAQWPRLAPGLFDLGGVTLAAWTLAAFAIGALAGTLIRRVVPAIVASLVAYTGLAVGAGGFLRQHYLAPLVTTRLNVPASAWIISQQWFTKGGRPAGRFVLSQVLEKGGPQLAGKGGVPHSPGAWRYLVQHGYRQWTSFQPASRYWPFQWIEASWLLVLSVLLISGTIWLVRRRAV